jgi:hypothetical protein
MEQRPSWETNTIRLVRNFPQFGGPQKFITVFTYPATDPCPKSDESSPQPANEFLQRSFSYHLHVGLPNCLVSLVFFSMARQPLGGLGRLSFRSFTITFRHTTLGRTPLDEGPARRRVLYLTTHNTHKRQTSMPPAGFEPIIPVSSSG